MGCKEWAEYEKKRNEVHRKRLIEAEANSIIVGSSVSHSAKRQRYDIAERARRSKKR